MMRNTILSGLVLLVSTVPGCALLSKSEPMVPRYFSLEPAAEPRASAAPTDLQLRLGPVTSGSEIRQNLVVRDAAQELSYSEERRWTEKPEAYLRRALSQELFERRGVRRVISGPSLSIEVELVSFEEVKRPAGSAARVAATVILHDERVVRMERTLTVEVPVERASAPDHADEAVRALGMALTRIVSHIADEVCREPQALARAP
jgi:cholesterol transport system auxiliary component